MGKCITVLAVCVALLGGCSTPEPNPTVVSVKCTALTGIVEIVGENYLAYETYYWSDGSKTYKGVYNCD